MYAAYIYLAVTLPVVIWAHRVGGVTRWSGYALGIWFCLAQAGYVRGEVEWESTYLIVGIQFLVVGYLVGKFDHHGLPLWFLVCNAAILLWNAFYGTRPDADPLFYKQVKNSIYLMEWAALLANCIWITLTRKTSE